MTKEQLGERVKALRMKNDISASELSKRMGVSRMYIYQVEKGATFPSMEKFFLLVKGLGVTEANFFEFKSEKYSEVAYDLLEKIENLSDKRIELLSALLDALS